MLYENKNYAKKAREKAAEIEAMLKRQARMTDGGQVKRSQRSVTLYLRCLAISTAQSKYAARMLRFRHTAGCPVERRASQCVPMMHAV